MSLTLEHRLHDSTDVLAVSGDIDLYTAPQLRHFPHQLLDDGQSHDVVIDLAGVPFMDSMALGVLMGGLKRARLTGGTVRLAAPNALAIKVLGITGLVKIFNTHPDLDHALAAPFDLRTSPSTS
jgi:anti-sigma B factor antagonist